MKTTKRFICPVRSHLCDHPCFEQDEAGIPDFSEYARWKRKNRIRSLKNTIRTKICSIDKLLRKIDTNKHDLDEAQKKTKLAFSEIAHYKNEYKRLWSAYQTILLNLQLRGLNQRPTSPLFLHSFGSCCGQDIEGS